jgi:hypothetical protein
VEKKKKKKKKEICSSLTRYDLVAPDKNHALFFLGVTRSASKRSNEFTLEMAIAMYDKLNAKDQAEFNSIQNTAAFVACLHGEVTEFCGPNHWVNE